MGHPNGLEGLQWANFHFCIIDVQVLMNDKEIFERFGGFDTFILSHGGKSEFCRYGNLKQKRQNKMPTKGLRKFLKTLSKEDLINHITELDKKYKPVQ